MEIHNVEITKVHQNTIEYKTITNKKKIHIYSLLLLLMIPVLALGCLRQYSETSLKDIYTNVCTLYNPIYSPYAETGNITFAGVFGIDEELENLEVPIISSQTRVDSDGTIICEVKESILVKSVADGVVEKIEELDGVKVVTILYAGNVSVQYINLDVLGVGEGNIVKRGKEIGTAKLGAEIQFKVFVNKTQLKGISIEGNKIVWQN